MRIQHYMIIKQPVTHFSVPHKWDHVFLPGELNFSVKYITNTQYTVCT